MRRQTAYRQRRSSRAALGLAGAILALALAPATVMAAGPPVIEGVGSAYGAEVTIGGKINPEGLEATYEIGLECSPCGPGNQWTKGTLPAVDESREVALALTGLQPGQRYWFTVRAVNADGETSRRGETLEIPSTLPSFPNGTGGTGIVEAPYIGLASQQMQQIAEQEAQRRAKEQEEQQAMQAASRPVTELAHVEEQADVRAQRKPPACRVPALKGDRLSVARRALRSAHCQLGAVHRPSRYEGTLRVSIQSAAAGERLANGARIALRLGARSGTVRAMVGK